MVRGRRARVAAVVRRDHQNVLLPHGGEKLRQALIKIRQSLGVPIHVIAVSVEHVIVHQIGKAQALEIPLHVLQGAVNALRVGGSAHKVRDAAAGENIIDLSHSQHILPLRLQHIQHGSLGGL